MTRPPSATGARSSVSPRGITPPSPHRVRPTQQKHEVWTSGIPRVFSPVSPSAFFHFYFVDDKNVVNAGG